MLVNIYGLAALHSDQINIIRIRTAQSITKFSQRHLPSPMLGGKRRKNLEVDLKKNKKVRKKKSRRKKGRRLKDEKKERENLNKMM